MGLFQLLVDCVSSLEILGNRLRKVTALFIMEKLLKALTILCHKVSFEGLDEKFLWFAICFYFMDSVNLLNVSVLSLLCLVGSSESNL